MTMLFTNRAKTQLARNITVVDTIIQLSSGDGALFPAPATPADYFPVTLVSVNSPKAYEIVFCVARNGDALTVLRGQEGTAAQPFMSGDIAALNDTASMFRRFPQAGDLGVFSAEVAASPGGYRHNAIVRDSTKTGLFWINNVDGNTTQPGAGNLTWDRLDTSNLATADQLLNLVRSPSGGGALRIPTIGAYTVSGIPYFVDENGKFYDLQTAGNYATEDDIKAVYAAIQGMILSKADAPDQAAIQQMGYSTTSYAVYYMGYDGKFYWLQPAGDYAHKSDLDAFVKKSDFSGNQTSYNGYYRLPDGTIFQWGQIGNPGGALNFNTSFPNKALQVFATNTSSQGDRVDNAFAYVLNNNQFYMATKQSTGGAITNYPCAWFAIGY